MVSSAGVRGAADRAAAQSAKLDDDVVFLAVKLGAAGTRAANEALDALGLRARPYSVLALAAVEPYPTQRELAEQLALDPSQIVALVDGLQDAGHVTRDPDPADRRSKIVVATTAGRALAAEAAALVAASERDVLGVLSARERLELGRLLAKAVGGA